MNFAGKIFDQVDGVAMGSPLGLAFANLFMGHSKQKRVESDYSRLCQFYRKYVDDIFCLFHFLNSHHPKLNFTIEKEDMKQLPFLDVLSTLSDRLIASVYRKNTFTGLLLNYNTFVLFTYINGLIKTLTD